MTEQLIRTSLLIGEAPIEKLGRSRVAVFGVGGVGGFTIEALARSGVGTIDIIDDDQVCESNINRQIIALHSTIGKNKVDVMKERIADINPDIRVNTHKCFYLPENADSFDFKEYDYIVDAIDTVTGKVELVMQAKKCGTPIICCMGAGNKLNPAMLEVEDLYKTSICPLAKVMRKELKTRGITHLKVVYSKEPPRKPLQTISEGNRRVIPGSIAFVPSVAGLIIASEVIKDLIQMC